MRDKDSRNALCTGHRATRPKIEVNCPVCNITIDTEAMLMITCPNPKCGVVFHRFTSQVYRLDDAIIAHDDQGSG